MLFMGPGNDLLVQCLTALFITVKLAGVFGQSIDPFEPLVSFTYGLIGLISSPGDEDKSNSSQEKKNN